MGRIISGLLMIVAGGAIIYFYNQLHKMFGDIEWAERNLGDSRMIYVLFGCFLIVIGVLFLFGIGYQNPTEASLEFGQ